MTKKHFERLAKIVRDMRELQEEAGVAREDQTANWLAHKLVNLCEEVNPCFDALRFLVACGATDNENDG